MKGRVTQEEIDFLNKMIEEPNRKYLTEDADWVGLIIRVPKSGHLCGYVRVPKYSPLEKLEYFQHDIDGRTEVHGGLTFSGEIIDEEGWWFGFDCVHHGDFSLTDLRFERSCFVHQTYKDFEYVEGEVKKLRRQLKELSKKWEKEGVPQ